MYDVFKAFLLPPGSLWLLIAAGVALLASGRRKSGLACASGGLLAWYVLSTPFVAGVLSRAIEKNAPLTDAAARNSGAQAIVVLGGGASSFAPEYAGESVDHITLERLRYAARLHRITRLPILVTGGTLPGTGRPLGLLMKQALEKDFGVPVQWVEARAHDTFENAAFSAATLRPAGIKRVLLVTHSLHMRRAERTFAAAGIEVVPASTIFTAPGRTFPSSFVPRLSALDGSYYAIYEWLGGLLYAARAR